MPLYRRPTDLVTQRLRRSGGKGKAGKRVVKRATAAYYDRAQIEDGALDGRDLEIVWLKGPIDAFFAEIQGSVRVRLEDGKVIRLNYADSNGHPYFAVGSVLIAEGIVSREEMSMQKIREYMEKFPEEGQELRRMNKSYVFFRETDLAEFDEAIGAQGISLTAARSIAVDRKIHTYGMPVFVNALLPIVTEKPDTWFRRLMIAQDTGGAIVGPARADIYLGAGDEAERAAGRFKHNGQFVMLIPNELDPDDEALGMPLPLPRPKEGLLSNMMSLFSQAEAGREAGAAGGGSRPKPADKSSDQACNRAHAPAAIAPTQRSRRNRSRCSRKIRSAEAAGRGQAGACQAQPRRVDPKPEAAPKQKPAPKPELAAKPDPAAKPQAKPAKPEAEPTSRERRRSRTPPRAAIRSRSRRGVAPPPPPPAPPRPSRSDAAA